MQPDLGGGRAFSPPLCFQDAVDKDLFDPDLKVKVQSSFMVSLAVAGGAEPRPKSTAGTFPSWHCANGPPSAAEPPATASVFGHEGGRLVVPNTGESSGGGGHREL